MKTKMRDLWRWNEDLWAMYTHSCSLLTSICVAVADVVSKDSITFSLWIPTHTHTHITHCTPFTFYSFHVHLYSVNFRLVLGWKFPFSIIPKCCLVVWELHVNAILFIHSMLISIGWCQMNACQSISYRLKLQQTATQINSNLLYLCQSVSSALDIFQSTPQCAIITNRRASRYLYTWFIYSTQQPILWIDNRMRICLRAWSHRSCLRWSTKLDFPFLQLKLKSIDFNWMKILNWNWLCAVVENCDKRPRLTHQFK